MTRDPRIEALIGSAHGAGPAALRVGVRRSAAAVAVVAAVGMLAIHAVLLPALTAGTRWIDLLVASVLGLVLTVAKHLAWPRVMLCDRPGRAQRRNAIWLLLPVVIVCSYYCIELAHAARSPVLAMFASALGTALIGGAAMAWAVSLAQIEHAIGAETRIGTADAARAVGIGVMGLILLIVAIGAARRFEYAQRVAEMQPAGELINLAGRQRMLSMHLGRSVARIGGMPQSQPELLRQFDTALARFIREAETLDATAAGWTPLHSAPARDASNAALARADTMRDGIVDAAREVRRAYRDRSDAVASAGRLQSAIDDGLPAFESVVEALQAATEHGRREVERASAFGFWLLALVGISGGIGVWRAVSFVVHRQGSSNAAHAAAAHRLAAVVRSTTNLVVTTDLAGRITWVNAAFENVTGYTCDEVIGKRPGSILQCPETDPRAVSQMHDAIARNVPSTVEILNQGKRGNRYWLRLTIEPLYDALAVQCGFMAIETDITEAVLLRQQRRGIFEAMAAGVVVQDSDGRITDCNSAACRMLGLDADQLCGRRSVDPRWRSIREDGSELPGEQHYAMHTLRTGETVSDGIMGVETPEGTRVWLSVSTQLMDDAHTGRRTVISSFTDLTLRKRAETELAIERARLAAALDGTGAGTWRWRIADGMLDVDSRWLEMVAGEPFGTGCVAIGDWMRRLHPDDAALTVEAAAMHRCGVSERFDVEVRVRNSRGHWSWVHCRGRIDSTDDDGRGQSMIGTLLDITARREAAIEFAIEQEKLQQLFELAPFGVALTDDEDSRVLDCNQALLDIVGMSRGELLRRTLRELTPLDYQEQWQQNSMVMDAAGRCGPFAKEYEVADGRRVPVTVTAQRIRLADGSRAVWVVVQDMTARKLLEEGLHREARTDKLTGLANRAALMERIESAVAAARVSAREGFGLLFLDFDRFKLVNDTLGHAAGDELLCLIAERLRKALRKPLGRDRGSSFVARIGGDEFVVLVPWTSDLAAIDAVAQRLLESLAAPYLVNGSELQSSASIGVVSSAQGDLDASVVLRNADTAMYEAKRRGRGLAVVYDHSMHARLQREVLVERHLRHAIGLGEVSIVYQPIVDLETGELASVEALARWNSAELGEVSPNEFIPIAEDCGVIAELGAWALHEACDQFAEWVASHPDARATISVNLSRVQMGKPEHLLRMIENTLEATGLAPNRLQLEVTERDVMRDPTAVLVLMRHLRAIGVRLAMDDFGTGTSSLACLRDYPFDVIKIDRAFVGDLDSSAQVMALVHATMMLIENLGMTSVAEGVETRAQAAILQSVGCRLGQGWLFGVPGELSAL
jgi:diguanylate cyclase (GGDEF)-like protein/PAS domain S-box-containing protein